MYSAVRMIDMVWYLSGNEKAFPLKQFQNYFFVAEYKHCYAIVGRVSDHPYITSSMYGEGGYLLYQL